MTTITAATAPSRRNESGRRILAVVRLLFVNKAQLIYQPLGGLVLIFLLNLAIWWVIVLAAGANPADHPTIHLEYSGAVSYIYVFGIIIAVQVILRTFPFSLGFGVTRRDFYLGAALGFLILSTLFAVALTAMSEIEIATNGWGIGGRMFAPAYFTDSFWLARFVMYLLAFLFCLFVGAVIATVYVRWRATGVVTFLLLVAVVLVAAVVVVTLTHRWPAVGSWIVRYGAFGVVLWTLVPTVLAAVGGFLVLRRATPKS